jgi:serine/threonine protein kinase
MWLGSPEKGTAHFNFILFTGLVLFSALGKRTIEHYERRTFTQLLHEKRMRFQTEFQLEMIGRPRVQRDVEATSDTTTVIFDTTGTIQPQLANKLEEIAVVGRTEQWLIDSTELRISEDCILGAGGFGIVVGGLFCAKPVAVKISKEMDTLISGRKIVDISNEVRVLRRVRHPNIVLFHGAYVDPQQCDFALVLERVTSCLLSRYILEHKLDEHSSTSSDSMTENRLRQLSSGICQALIYLHSRKPAIVHGDLKPENIAVETSDLGPHPKLLDFGLSRILGSGARPRGRTLTWAAPEILLRPDDPAETSSDVFAYGCILYFILTGTAPREGQTRHQIMRSARQEATMALQWPFDHPCVEECRHLIFQCIQPKALARLSIHEVFEQLVLIVSPTGHLLSLGERPSAFWVVAPGREGEH